MPGKLSVPEFHDSRTTFGHYGLLYFGFIAIIFTSLSISYSYSFGNLLYVNDFWFGGDVSRHIYWTVDPEKSFRSHLHPLSFLLFKGYGWVLNIFSNAPENSPFQIIAFPVILITSIFIVICVKLMVPLRLFPLGLQIAVVITLLFVGPTLVFAPVPESHVLGGVSLLLQALLIWLWLQHKANNEYSFNYSNTKWITGGVIFFTLLTTGFTLSNLMPATIMILAIPEFRRPILKLAIFGFGFLILLWMVHKLVLHFPFITRTGSNIMKETAWLIIPDFSSFVLSIKNLLLAQFGLSLLPELQVWTSEGSNEVFYYIEQHGPTIIQLAAFLLWSGGIIWHFWRTANNKTDIHFTIFCLLSLASIIGFHTLYATGEAYIFSAHAWPYVVLPGLITIRNSWLKKDFWPMILIFTAVALSMLQMLLGLNLLLNLQLPHSTF